MATATAETIAALATPAGRGGVGIVRVSGSGLAPLIESLTGAPLHPRRATLRRFRDAAGEPIDEGIALYFPAPHSFTGEDVLELQGHGGPLVMARLLAACLAAGARPARPGEFSERAFHNGRLDLAQAEAVADLIDAGTFAAARSALRSLTGEFSAAVGELAASLVRLRTLAEATLDFSDEDVGVLGPTEAVRGADGLLAALARLERRAQRGQLLRDGLRVVLIGRPNVGKSSLLNRLAGEELALVSEHAGTTRDSLRGSVQVRGLPLAIVDTAGLRDTEDPVERLGIERTRREIERADLALVVADARTGVQAEDRAIIDSLPPGLRVLTVLNKSDLLPAGGAAAAGGEKTALPVSALSGEGMEALEEALLAVADWHPGEGDFIARERHLDALRRCRGHLERARENAAALELFAEELRLAHRALQEITGEYGTEELLGEIFATFCIGK
jgi:tRNA modification GTPase